MFRIYPQQHAGLGQLLMRTTVGGNGGDVILPSGEVMHFDFNPLDWIEDAAGWIYKGVSSTGGWIWDGAKWVYGKAKDRCTWILGGPLVAFAVNQFKDEIRKAGGCSPEAQATAVVAISAKTGNPLVAGIAVSEIVACICKKGPDNVQPPNTKPPIDKGKVATGVVIAAAITAGLLLFVRRR